MSGKTCLDLFAGSGAMGIEAASRGSELVVMVESSPTVYSVLQTNLQKLRADQIELLIIDALEFIMSDQLIDWDCCPNCCPCCHYILPRMG